MPGGPATAGPSPQTTIMVTPTTCLIDLSLSPLSSRELPQVRAALSRLGIKPQWLHTVEKQSVYFLELRTEMQLADCGEQELAERLARDVWKTIGRYVRIVVMFPEQEQWPGGIEFGEADYTRLLRHR